MTCGIFKGTICNLLLFTQIKTNSCQQLVPAQCPLQGKENGTGGPTTEADTVHGGHLPLLGALPRCFLKTQAKLPVLSG